MFIYLIMSLLYIFRKNKTVYIKITCMYIFPSDQQKSQLTSLCPTLGKRYAEIHLGICPSNLQSPFGKTLPVSFLGNTPYIIYTNPIRGSDFLVMEIFANMFGFRPAFHPERSRNAMAIKVWKFLFWNDKKFKLPLTGFCQAKRNRNRPKNFFDQP